MKQRRWYGTLLAKAVAAGVLLAGAALAQVALMGRDASNDPSATCTVNGTVSGITKCISFYNDILDITIQAQRLSQKDHS